MNARQNLHLIKLLHEHCGLRLESLGIFGSPPISHISVLVEETALVVETVSHLVADDNADGSVVHCIISVRIVERRLENRSREADFVGRRVVIGIHRLRAHQPFSLVHRFSEASQVVLYTPESSLADVLVVACRRVYVERGIILPLVRIAYFYGESIQFLVSLCLGGITHPVKRVDVLGEGGLDVRYHFRHSFLVLCREIFRHIHLAHGL